MKYYCYMEKWIDTYINKHIIFDLPVDPPVVAYGKYCLAVQSEFGVCGSYKKFCDYYNLKSKEVNIL